MILYDCFTFSGLPIYLHGRTPTHVHMGTYREKAGGSPESGLTAFAEELPMVLSIYLLYKCDETSVRRSRVLKPQLNILNHAFALLYLYLWMCQSCTVSHELLLEAKKNLEPL